jgi:hypothetical protein
MHQNKFRLIFLRTNDFKTYLQNKVHASSLYRQTIISKRKEKRPETVRIPPFSKLLSVFWIVWLMVFSISY